MTARYNRRMFSRLGDIVGRRPYWLIAAWLAVVLVLWTFSPDPERVAAAEPVSVLPADAPSNQALELMRAAFPELTGRSRAVLVLERVSGLTPEDFAYIDGLAERLRAESPSQHPWKVLAPGDSPLHRQRLVSGDGQCAMVAVLLEEHWTSKSAARRVDQIQSLCREGRPAGLRLEITGTAGLGRDYARVSDTALRRTTKVTVVLVFVILAFVYRAPLAALVPLLSITCSVLAALKVLDYLAVLGWEVSSREKMFTVVLLYGAGTDYALFWISRYREELAANADLSRAAVRAMGATGPAILASAGTTILGLASMMVARLIPTHNAGRIMAVVLIIALLASTTLAPSLARIAGAALFWPGRLGRSGEFGTGRVWLRLARLVRRRPVATMVVALALMLPPIWTATRIEFHYDTLAELPPGSSAAQGAEIAEAHFPPGKLYPTTLLVRAGAAALAGDAADRAAGAIEQACLHVPGVEDVDGLASPAGRSASAAALNLTTRLLGRERLRRYFVSADPPVMRFTLYTRYTPLSVEAMATVARARKATAAVARELIGPGASVLAEGVTPYIADVREITRRDRRWVMAMAPAVIWLIVLVLVRDVSLSVFMLLATLMTFGTTLGLTEWVFVHLLGGEAIDWKVDIFLFVIIVAVGQDYNIFLVTRLFQERRFYGVAEAAERAVGRTGSIISSCGLIMAATLGSLMSAGLKLYEQLGFALAAGILIDTFLVRPMLIPSFYLIRDRLRPSRARAKAAAPGGADVGGAGEGIDGASETP